jgi:exonuclease I
MNKNKICVFDFETDGSNPLVCSPVQIAAIMIDPIKLEIISGSEFNANFKPEVLENDKDYVYTTDILDFHI